MLGELCNHLIASCVSRLLETLHLPGQVAILLLPAQPGNLLDGNTPLVADRANSVQFVRFFPSIERPEGKAKFGSCFRWCEQTFVLHA